MADDLPKDNVEYPRLLAALGKLLPGPQEHPPFDGFLRYLEGEGGFDFAALYLHGPNHDNHSLVLTPSADQVTGSEPDRDFFITYEKLAQPPFEQVLSVFELPGEGGPDSPYVGRFLAPNDLADALLVNFRNPDTFAARMLVAVREGRAFSDADRAFLNALVPYLAVVCKNFHQVNYLEAKANLYDELVVRVGVGEFRLNASGEVIYCNTMAQALLDDGHLLVRRNARLYATDPEDNETLQGAIARYLEDAPIKPSDPVYLHSRDPYDMIGLLVRQLPPQLDKESRETAVVGIYLGDHSRRMGLSEELLGKLFDLSAAEARVAVLLAQGLNAKEIARRLHVSSNTVRTHIGRIYTKTGINRQAELTAFLVRILASTWPGGTQGL